MANPIDQYDGIFKAAAAEWNVDPVVLKALALHESGGRVDAVGKSGEQGLMQIMPGTQRQLGVTKPFDAEQSIYGGAKYLAMALDAEHDNPTAALRYYNGGPGWRTSGGDPKYPSYVGVQYQKLAKADTGTLTDAAPAPPGASPAATAQAAAPDYNNAPAGPSAKPTTAPAGKAPDPYDAALKGDGASKAAEPDAYTKALGTPVETAPTEPPATTFDEYGRPLTDGVPPSIADQMDAARKATAPTKEDVSKFLAPAPNTTYGDILPLAKDNTTGAIRLALPNIIRNPLIGLTEGPGTDGTFGSSGVTWNPETRTYGLTPEAASVGQFAATPLRFSGANPLQFVPPGSLQRRPLPAGATALNPDAAARIRAAQGAPVPVEPPTVPTPFNTPPTAAVPGVSAEAAAAAAQAKPTSLPTGVPVTPPEAPPSARGGAAGAQVTPSYEAIHTPAEEAAYRANAEGKKLIEGQKIGEPDLNQYIPGETVNNAEREQTAKAARELKELGIRVPEASQLDKEAAESNNTARVIYAENTAKGPVEIANRRTQRETDIKADKAQVFAPDNVTGPVDFAPVIKQMEAVLKEPENRQNSALQSVYREQLERIKAANIEDPPEAWGLRRDLDRLTDKRMAAKDPNLHYVAHHLDDVANLIDSQIENVAPGYSDMLAKYKEHSRAISEMEVLQGALKNLRGPGQKMTYNDFQRFMKNVVDSRMTPSTDLNAYKAISEENMQRLWNIRDSLRRTASAKELAAAAGSDTMPNIIDALKGIGKMGGTAALHTYVGAHLGPGGNLALQSLGALGKSLNDRRMIRRATQQMQNLLRPSEPLRVPPGQENPLTGAPP